MPKVSDILGVDSHYAGTGPPDPAGAMAYSMWLSEGRKPASQRTWSNASGGIGTKRPMAPADRRQLASTLASSTLSPQVSNLLNFWLGLHAPKGGGVRVAPPIPGLGNNSEVQEAHAFQQDMMGHGATGTGYRPVGMGDGAPMGVPGGAVTSAGNPYAALFGNIGSAAKNAYGDYGYWKRTGESPYALPVPTPKFRFK